MTTACRNCAGVTTDGISQKRNAAWRRGLRVACEIPQAHERGRGPYQRDADLLSPPRAHHKHLKSTNMLERLNEEIKRRTRVARIFPNTESCLRLVRALCVETHETWLEHLSAHSPS